MLLFCHIYGTESVNILLEQVSTGKLKFQNVKTKIKRYLNELSWLLYRDVINLCGYLISSKKNAVLKFNQEREPYVVHY